MFGRKGQGAMEYLMTYGWAILVVMIVGIVMWQLGIFNPAGTQATTMQGFGAVKPQLSGTGYDTTGAFTGVFLNAGGSKIKVTEIKITDAKSNVCICNLANVGTSCVGPMAGLASYSDNKLPVSANENIELSCSDGTNSVAVGDAGDSFEVDVQISYEAVIGGRAAQRSSSGKIRGPLE